MPVTWNPWHGCQKYSPGCANCYVYRTDARHGRDPSLVEKTAAFDLPVRKRRDGSYHIPAGEMVYTCFTSDFFLDQADDWRAEAWRMIRQRRDLLFLFITKRIERFPACIPADWAQGYPNVHICVTAENEQTAEQRLPLFLTLPVRYKSIVCEPLLGYIDLSPYLDQRILEVIAGGESGEQARVCRYEWILALREQCDKAHTAFHFKQTGARFEKEGRIYRVQRKFQHAQARNAGIDIPPRIPLYHDFVPQAPLTDQLALF